MTGDKSNKNRAEETQQDVEASDAPLQEEVVPEDEADHSPSKIKALREKLSACEREKQEYLTGWQRAKADLINARRRDEEERRAFALRANEGLASELIPVLESFDAAITGKPHRGEPDKDWGKGVLRIADQLRKIISSHGVNEINPIGKPFDPARDEAVGLIDVEDEAAADTVIEVVSKGYSLNGHPLKAPKVKVGKIRGNDAVK